MIKSIFIFVNTRMQKCFKWTSACLMLVELPRNCLWPEKISVKVQKYVGSSKHDT